MRVVHLVTYRMHPYPGGLQQSLLRIARGLVGAGHTAIIYTLGQPAGYRDPHPDHAGLTVEHLGAERDLLLEPFSAIRSQAYNHDGEPGRIGHLLVRNAIERHIRRHPDARHVIVSFYISGTSFVVQPAAVDLGVPHIASIRGTDFELELHSPVRHPKVRFVIETADQLVTTNRGQATAIAAMFSTRRPPRTIHNALPGAGDRPPWEPPDSDAIRLVSDCGFSGRKATQLLVRAVESLVERGLPVTLTILGGIFWVEDTAYWERIQRECDERHPGTFVFPGHRPEEELDDHLRAAHIYCSATLAEGCSMSRIRALTLGIPIVTTRCGALPELASDCAHVRLCPPGDGTALTEALARAVKETKAGTLRPDSARVAQWRRHFSPERERDEWLAAIAAVLPEPDPVA